MNTDVEFHILSREDGVMKNYLRNSQESMKSANFKGTGTGC